MGVIIRETRKMSDGKEVTEGVYRGSSPPSPDDIKHAEELDQFLDKRLDEISGQLESQGVLKGRRGSSERWYQLGKLLAEIVDDEKTVLREDRANDFYIWIAIEQRAPSDIQPNKKITERKNTWTKRNHFRLSYLLATKFSKSIVDKHTWREWVEILESPAITEDERILDWISDQKKSDPSMPLRPLARTLRQNLKDMHTQVLSQEELEFFLNPLWDIAKS